jgi:hypothetical protein
MNQLIWVLVSVRIDPSFAGQLFYHPGVRLIIPQNRRAVRAVFCGAGLYPAWG